MTGGKCSVILILCQILICTAVLVSSSTPREDEDGKPIVDTVSGQLRGKWLEARNGRKYAAFEGIPYATIPVRFAPPGPAPTWTGIKDVTIQGSVCPQFELTLQKIIGESEECLFANIYVPTDSSGKLSHKKLPVMVWLHGGGYIFGAGNFEGAQYILEEDIIFITINYRLGSFGFLDFGPSYTDTGINGNMGLKDMISFLKWSQQNIENFGGNPENTEIFGESAGAAAVHALALSPAAVGLFQKYSMHSGSLLCPWSWNSKPLETAKRFAVTLNCADKEMEEENWDMKKVTECLREKPIVELVQADWTVSMMGAMFVLALSPTVDATSPDYSVLPDTPLNLMQNYNNHSLDLPHLIGYNEKEGLHFATSVLQSEGMTAELNTNWHETVANLFALHKYLDDPQEITRVTEEIRQFYLGQDIVSMANEKGVVALYTDYYMNYPVKETIRLHAKGRKNPNVYPFVFVYSGKFSLMQFQNVFSEDVCHADDLQYLFPSTMGPPKNWPDLEEGTRDEEFSRNFIRTWTSFAKAGVPESWGQKWTPVSTTEDNLEIKWLNLKETPKMEEMNLESKRRIEFWENLLPIVDSTVHIDEEGTSWSTWLFYLFFGILPILLLVYAPNVKNFS